MRKALSALSEEIMVIVKENKKDDLVDADGDGTADAQALEGPAFVKRKVALVLAKVNPQKVNAAIRAIYKGIIHTWLASLRFIAIIVCSPQQFFPLIYPILSMDECISCSYYPVCEDHRSVLDDL